MNGYRNVTFDEIEIGATASAERVVGQTEIEALLLVSGDVVPFNLVEGVTVEPSDLCVEAVAAEAIISGMLERRLPGPGTRIVSHQFDMGDWPPEKKVERSGHTLYFWTIPPR